MTINKAEIVTCPCCGADKELLSLISDTPFLPICWSDGRQITPFLPEVSPVQKCPQCGKYFLHYKSHSRVGDRVSFEIGMLSYEEWLEAYAQFSLDKSANDLDRWIINTGLILAFNDRYNRGFTPLCYQEITVPPQDAQEYMVKVINEFIRSADWNGNSNLLLKSELYRETGDFANCEQTLHSIDTAGLDDDELTVFNMMRQKVDAKDRLVFKIS